MDLASILYDFMNLVKDDPRIGPSHISLYLAIVGCYKEQEFQLPVTVFSKNLMKQAKISATGTYHRCMRDLVDSGYINYIPSYNPVLGSLVFIKWSD